MRIIGGHYGGRVLTPVPKQGVRPTADPVREALFNILGACVSDGGFLDLAAGTGAVGLEAYSRGARPVVLVDKDRKALETIRRNVRLLEGDGPPLEGLKIVAEDVLRWLRAVKTGDLSIATAFLDPPYDRPRLGPWLQALAASGVLLPGAWVIVEHRTGHPPDPGPLTPRWTRRYGDSSLSAFQSEDPRTDPD